MTDVLEEDVVAKCLVGSLYNARNTVQLNYKVNISISIGGMVVQQCHLIASEPSHSFRASGMTQS